MKKTLLFFSAFIFFLFTFFNRYQPVSLDLVKPTTIEVEIKGAVQSPGVYTLKWQSTVSTLISASGGLLDDADDSTLSYTKLLNDKDVIVVAQKNESVQLISLNSATLEQLDTLPGIGPSIAQRIIDYRTTQSFTTLEQIKEVKGIGDALYEKIKDCICL
jgi:competence protein ComEA